MVGDCIAMMAKLEPNSVDCVVTSPPYWQIRDYGVSGQMGLEPTLGEHIAGMVAVFQAVRRVLKPSGTVWLNYGDSYYAANGRSAADTKGALKPKDLCMIPNRLAIALQEDGWWIRSEIVWGKLNPMPESAKDRPATAHEKIWMLTKSARYFFDSDAVGVERTTPYDGKMPDGWDTGPGAHGSFHRQGREKGKRTDKKAEQQAGGRNLRNYEPAPIEVWPMATRPFPDAHFATFPPELAERCIKAGSSEKGCCADCGAPWQRQTDVSYENPGNRTTNGARSLERRHEPAGFAVRLEKRVATTGWAPSCECDVGNPVAAVVLDPFGGAGTTGLVADRLQRDAIMIELKPEYAAMCESRIKADSTLFSDVEKCAL